MTTTTLETDVRVVGPRLVEWARAQEGVVWVHQGRVPRAGRVSGGMDCVGLPVCDARAQGFAVEDLRTYSETPTPAQLVDVVSRNCVQISEDEPGSLVLLWLTRQTLPRHAVISDGEGGFIHASRSRGKVCVDRFGDWLPHVHTRWRLKWLTR